MPLHRLALLLATVLLASAAGADAAAPAETPPTATAPAVPPGAPAPTALPPPAAPRCADVATLDLQRILPPPPGAHSPQERTELAELLRIQHGRTSRQAARARADAVVSVFRFADALGNSPRFTPQAVPLTSALFDELLREEASVMLRAKNEFARPRPFRTDARVAPVIDLPVSDSYPSGHSTWARAAGLVLADMVPERRAQILTRAQEYAHNRMVAGVHYSSDVQAGALAGTALAALLFACPSFQAQEAAAKLELRAALGLAPGGAAPGGEGTLPARGR